MKKNRFISLFASAFMLASCALTPSKVIKGPSEDGGLEGNAELDKVELQSTKELEDMFNRVYKLTKFSYEVQLHVGSNNSHFVNYFSNNAFYAEEDYKEGSFGLAQNRRGEIFKFYLDTFFSC
ncbi:MAG: hypothetical protein MJ238_01485 [Bacilli bacterium]|nr:hypothetical protein [Bacilli bacterium]